MIPGTRVSLIGSLTTLTIQLDGLCIDQNSEDLSKLYLSFLVADEKRAKALLEVFDKVCPGNACHPMKRFST